MTVKIMKKNILKAPALSQFTYKASAANGLLQLSALFAVISSIFIVYLNIPQIIYLETGIVPWITLCVAMILALWGAVIYGRWQAYRGLWSIFPLLILLIINFLFQFLDQSEYVRQIASAYVASMTIGILLGILLVGCNPTHLSIAFYWALFIISIGIIFDAFILQDYFLTIQPDRVLGRFAFTHTNPNEAAEAIILLIIISIYISGPSKILDKLIPFASIPIFLTFSRAGFIIYILCLFWYFVYVRNVKLKFFISIFLSLISFPFIILSIFNFILTNTAIENRNNIVDRMNFFTSFQLQDDSTSYRSEYLNTGMRWFIESPLRGHSPGFSMQTTPDGLGYHNQWLYLGVEYGLAGIIFFIAILFPLLMYPGKDHRAITVRWFGIILLLFSWVSHNLFNWPIWMAAIVYFTVVAKGERGLKRASN